MVARGLAGPCRALAVELCSPLGLSHFDEAKRVPHFYFVDLLRGLSAVAVLVWHYQHFYWTPTSGLDINFSREPLYFLLKAFYTNGYWAVEFFWMISGFVFAHIYAQKTFDAVTYFTNRFSRLYPLNFATLLLVAGLQQLSLLITGHELSPNLGDGRGQAAAV
jgi:peptidoglycan/LPS O-acetylase OafA/YrhL